MDSDCGILCKECEENVRCNIYNTRPEECKIFLCCYAQMEKAHTDLRPDNCGIMFEKINDTLILGSVDGELENISELVTKQIHFFIKERISVMIQKFNPHKFRGVIAEGATREEIIKALEARNK
jgi:hypothetical protein